MNAAATERCAERILALLVERGRRVSVNDLKRRAKQFGFSGTTAGAALAILRRRNDIERFMSGRCRKEHEVAATVEVRGACCYCGSPTSNRTWLAIPNGFREYWGEENEVLIEVAPLDSGTGSLFVDLRSSDRDMAEWAAQHCGAICRDLELWWEGFREAERERADDAREEWQREAKYHIKCLRRQIVSVKRWLQSRDPEAFRSLPPGYGPLRGDGSPA
jgi:hypothetical protein